MLFDAFIAHASEDKDELVRPLARLLQQNHVEVWYDEFSLSLGDSLRRSIDRGLAHARFGIVVISPNFIRKPWPAWELDGLVARQNLGGHTSILPIWHNVGHDEVVRFSPALSDKFAVSSSAGIEAVARRILDVIRPRGSTLILARDRLLDLGQDPPVISDDWWLDLAAESQEDDKQIGPGSASGRDRWSFPPPRRGSAPSDRAERLVQSALQRTWTREAKRLSISQVTHPAAIFDFIQRQPGLMEVCHSNLAYLLAYAPQLAIPSAEGAFKSQIDEYYLTRRNSNPAELDVQVAFRDFEYLGYQPLGLASYFIDGGDGVHRGAGIYEPIEVLSWLFSDSSSWLPSHIRKVLTRGVADGGRWLWREGQTRKAVEYKDWYDGEHTGALAKYAEGRTSSKLNNEVVSDAKHRLEFSRRLLQLPESAHQLSEKLLSLDFDGFLHRHWEARSRGRSLYGRISR